MKREDLIAFLIPLAMLLYLLGHVIAWMVR